MDTNELFAYLNSLMPIADWGHRHLADVWEHDQMVSTPPITAGLRGAIVNHLNDICGGDTQRKLFLFTIFGAPSSKELAPLQWAAFFCWLDPLPDDDGHYHVRPACESEARAVVRSALTYKVAA